MAFETIVKRNTLYYGNCLELMKGVPDKSVDLILADLPFGTTQAPFDVIIPPDQLWLQYERIAKPNADIVLNAMQPFTSMLCISNPKLFKYSLIWDKCLATGFLNSKKQPLRVHEEVLVFYDKPPVYNPQFFYKADKRKMSGMEINPHSQNYGEQKKYVSTAHDTLCYPLSIIKIPQIRGNSKEKCKHPQQKPVALSRYFIETYTNPGALVLDNCTGSGTTPIACIETGRDWIAMENYLSNYELAKSRITKALTESNSTLFNPAPAGSR